MRVDVKYCIVPHCHTNSFKDSKLEFIRLPHNLKKRRKWFDIINPSKRSMTNNRLFVCEKHFDLEKDVENYVKWKLMRCTNTKIMKKDVIPHKFACLPDNEERIRVMDTLNGGIAKPNCQLIIKNEILEEASTEDQKSNLELIIKGEILEDPLTEDQYRRYNQDLGPVIKTENLEDVFVKEETDDLPMGNQNESNIENIAEDIFVKEDMSEQLTVRDDLFTENRDKSGVQIKDELEDNLFVKDELNEELMIKDDPSIFNDLPDLNTNYVTESPNLAITASSDIRNDGMIVYFIFQHEGENKRI